MISCVMVTVCWIIFGATSLAGDIIDGVVDDFGVAFALLVVFVFGVDSDAVEGVDLAALGVRFIGFDALFGAGDFSTILSHLLASFKIIRNNNYLQSLLTPVTAMLTGRAFLTGVVLLLTIAELVVDDDIALPGLELDILFGVISPERSPVMKC